MLARLSKYIHEAEQPLVANAHLRASTTHEPTLGGRRNFESEVVRAEQWLFKLAGEDLVEGHGQRVEGRFGWADEDELFPNVDYEMWRMVDAGLIKSLDQRKLATMGERCVPVGL